MKRYAVLFAVLWIGDAATTAYGILAAGAGELNPVGPVLALALKAIAIVAALAFVRITPYRLATAAPFIVALAVPVAWNAALLAG